MAKGKKEKIFNDRPRKVFRNYIGRSEVWFGIGFVAFTLAMGWWFIAQSDRYDPSERDISMELLEASIVEDHLWEPPLKRWVDPAHATVAGTAALPDLGIFPPVILEDGWELDSRLAVFDSDNLYEKIDGREVLYKSFGFQFLHYISILNPSEDLGINFEVYDQGEFQNALGVFAAQRDQDAPVETVGNAYYHMTDVGALGIVENYFFMLTGTADSPLIREHALAFVSAFQKSVGNAGQTPASFTLLAKDLGLKFQDIQYQKENVFQYDFASDFWFGKAGDSTDLRYYVHKADGPEAAGQLYDQIVEEHAWDYEVAEQNDSQTLFYHEFLKTYTTVNRSGEYIYGVEQAASPEAAATALDKLAGSIFDDPA